MAATEFGAEISVIKKTSPEYTVEKDPPPCPSVMVNGKLLVRNGTVSYADIKSELAGA
jgi:hypothetical protein